MAKICLCLTAKTIDRNLEILNKYRKSIDMAELRVDCLDNDERLYIRRFPELAGLPVALTIRRDIDGGYYNGGEGARVKLMARALAFANADSRMNFAYVDIEDDLKVPSLEEAARTFGTRIIRSYHNMDGTIENIPEKIKSMVRSGDEIVKVSLLAKSTNDVMRVYQASKTCSVKNRILICMGHYGIYSRILAERFGSFLTYTSALSEGNTPGAPGQLDINDLTELYHFKKITKKTKIFGVVGNPLKSTASPWFFNSVFNLENADAVYVPFPADSINVFMELARELDIQGLSVTVPYKEAILSSLADCSAAVNSIGACNTVYRQGKNNIEPSSKNAQASQKAKSKEQAVEWYGDNTDITGFSESLLAFIQSGSRRKIKNLKRFKITIIGAGGMARAAAFEIYRLGGKALILNRTIHKARNIASQYNFRWGGIDTQGIELIPKFNDIIIQTTSLGMEGYENADPLELYNFTGKEAVMDAIYTPPVTPFLLRASKSGCRTLNGFDMIKRQASLQFFKFLGREIPEKFLSRLIATGENTWNRIRTG